MKDDGYNPLYKINMSDETFDFEMPDIPSVPHAEEKKFEDKNPLGFKFGFIGAGQGGGKLAEAFSKSGYARVGVVNTADQDLASIDVVNKLKFGNQQGAGKNRDVAKKSFLENKEDIVDFIKTSVGKDIDRIFVTLGAGGGTGAGVSTDLVLTVREYQESVKAGSPYVGVIIALPKITEGKKVSQNAYETLNEMVDLVEKGIVSPLIILDNEKINTLYPGLSISQFWQVSNANICSLFNLFNSIVTKNSSYSTFDANDYRTVLDSGIIVFGAATIPNISTEAEVSKAVRENIKRNILCGELDLSTGNIAAVVAIADEATMDKIPLSYIDGAFNQLNRTLREGSTVHQGIYKGAKQGLSIFTAIGGLAKPEEKLSMLLKNSK